MSKKLIIIKKNSSKGAQESGCCLRSCGGMPMMQKPTDKKGTLVMKQTEKIK
jgi:hypothetical protein